MDAITGDTPASPASPKKAGLLINRDFALLWLGQAISSAGDFVFDTTLVVWIATQLAVGQPWAPLAVSGVLVAATLPIFLVGPFAGVFADRWDKRRTMLAMDAARAALIALLLLAAGIVPLPFLPGGQLSLPQRLAAVYAIVFLAAACAQFFTPARTALLGDIVEADLQPRAASLSQVTFALATIIGPPLAAPLLFAFGVQWALVINAASFLASYLAIRAIRPPRQTASAERAPRASFLREWGQGVRFYFGNRVLATLLVAGVIAVFGAGALNALDVFFVTQNLHADPTIYGVFGSVYAVGALLGAVLGGVFAQRIGLTRLVWLSLLLLGIGILAFSRMTSVPPALAVLFVTGIPQATLNIAIGPLVLRVTPRELIGRVMAVLNPVITGASLVSIAIAGYLASTALHDFHARVAGLELGPLDTIFGVAALLIIVGALYAAVALRAAGGEATTQPFARRRAALVRLLHIGP
ncbi:MAG TPA: MFS transporter [Ktedonobacterales bacterium]|jgi:MFS family permease|nr:MFS transporter [Ktedonobacterales bacterium]